MRTCADTYGEKFVGVFLRKNLRYAQKKQKGMKEELFVHNALYIRHPDVWLLGRVA